MPEPRVTHGAQARAEKGAPGGKGGTGVVGEVNH